MGGSLIQQGEFFGGCQTTAVLNGGDSVQFDKRRYVLLSASGSSALPVKMLMPYAAQLMFGFSYIVSFNNLAANNTVSVVNFLGQTQLINCADGVARAAPTGEQIAGGPGYPAIMIRLIDRSIQTWTAFSIGDSRIG